MIENKNALAELAERMAVVTSRGGDTWRWLKDVIKAQRIVAELAKVEDRHDGETNSNVLRRCNDCIAKCRAIAEKGENNDK